MTRDVLLGTISLVAGNGGIARLARLTAKALAETSQSDALALLDDQPTTDLGMSVRVAKSSKARFALALHRAAMTHRRFIYDFAGPARAHPRLPFLNRPSAVWMCGTELWELARSDRLRALRAADLLLSISEYSRDRADQLHRGMARARVCWLGTEHDELPPARSRRGPPVVLIVARLDDDFYKGHTELLQAWPRVVSAVPDARLVIVGGGSRLGYMRECARKSPVASNIDVRGFLSEEAMPAEWASATVFAMPSRGEGFGLVYVEAMRYGLPVIASVHDAGREVNVHGVSGYNVDLDRQDELTDTLIRLLRDETHAEELGRQARARWLEQFRFTAFRRRFLSTIDDFLA